jgi:hypothetical protein
LHACECALPEGLLTGWDATEGTLLNRHAPADTPVSNRQ